MKGKRAEVNQLVRDIREAAAAGKPLPKPGNLRERTLWHPALSGLGVRHTYTGQASWIVVYKLQGRTQRTTIGDVRVIDESVAIKAARELLAKVVLQRFDPQAAKEEAKRTAKITFEAVVEQFLNTWKKEGKRPQTMELYTHALTHHFASFNKRPFDDITHETITLELDRIHNSSGAGAARVARVALNVLFNWGIRRGLHPGPSPMLRVDKPPKAERRNRVLAADEIRVIWHACEGLEADALSGKRHRGRHPLRPDKARVIRLLFLTACRVQEIGDLEWDEIKWPQNQLEIRGSRTKNHETHHLPLVDTALDILKSVQRRPDRKYVFGVTGAGCELKSNVVDKINERIAQMGGKVPAHWTIHDIRRTVRTGMGELGIRGEIAERVLNHVGHLTDEERTYDRFEYGPQMREALVRWEDKLLHIVYGTELKYPAPRFGSASA
jgi:integrase